jgi:hypothetical protein
MTNKIRLTAAALLTAIGLSIVPAGAAYAGSKGKRNTAIGLGAVAVYGIAKKKPLVAGLAGGGAIYSYMQSRKDARRERARRRARAYRARHRRVYYRHGRRYYR